MSEMGTAIKGMIVGAPALQEDVNTTASTSARELNSSVDHSLIEACTKRVVVEGIR